VVRGWVDAAEEIVTQRDSTDHIPDAEEVVGQDGEDPDPARSGGVEAGSAAADRDAPEPAPATDESVRADQEPDPAEVDPEALFCASCLKRITEVPVIADSPIGLVPYHSDCAPM